jgi:hypothetical protein
MLGEKVEVDAGTDRTGAASGAEDLEHGCVDGGGRLAGQFHQLLAGSRWRLVQR